MNDTTSNRCTFCSMPGPVMTGARACICLPCARLAVETLACPKPRSESECPRGCDNEAVHCGVLQCWQAFQELPTRPCNCPCHKGES